MNQKQLESFESLASEYAQKIREGKADEIEDYATRNPLIASRIRRLFPVLQMMEMQGESRDSWTADELLRLEPQLPPLNELPTKMLGDFLLIREIGRGGMGIVYEAEQKSLGRRVAVKVLPHVEHLGSRKLTRFQTEAKALANLHHTNIVSVFGVGQESGLSYFVMQLIEGQPIDQMIEKKRSVVKDAETDSSKLAGLSTEKIQLANQKRSIDQSLADTKKAHASKDTNNSPEDPSLNRTSERPNGLQKGQGTNSLTNQYYRDVARIGVAVAEALSYAHDQGVLHRDIKPSNLLLGDSGDVWVTDFGLAKFDNPDLTQTGEVLGTLRYMSPEQLAGNATESSDVFGLGLTLFEMLTLTPAYQNVDRRSLLENVATANVPRPRSFNSRIPRDLETIICKCLEADRNARYKSAKELADDLKRYLNGQPIFARRSSVVERAWKWCKRKPVIASMSAALALSIVTGLAGVTWQWRETSAALAIAEKNFNEAKMESQRADFHFDQAQQTVVEFFELTAAHPALASANFVEYRMELIEKAQDYFTDLIAGFEQRPDLKWKMAYAKVKFAQLNDAVAKQDEALVNLEECFALLSESEATDEESAISIIAIRIQALILKGSILVRTDPKAIEYLREAVALGEEHYEQVNDHNKRLLRLHWAYRKLALALDGNTSPQSPDFVEVEKAYQRSFQIVTYLFERDEENRQEGATMLSHAYYDMALLSRQKGEPHETIVGYFDQALEYLEYARLKFSDEVVNGFLGTTLNSYGVYEGFRRNADLEKSIKIFERAKEIFSAKVLKYGDVIQFRSDYGRILTNMGRIYQDLGETDKALKSRQLAVDVRKGSVDIYPDRPKIRSELGNSLMSLGIIFDERNDTKKAMTHFVQAKEHHMIAVEQAPGMMLYQVRLAMTQGNIGQLLERTGEYAKAMQQYIDMVPEKNRGPEPYYLSGRELIRLAITLRELDEPSQEELEIAVEAVNSAKENFSVLIKKGFNPQPRLMQDQSFDDALNKQTVKELWKWFDVQSRERPSPK